MKKHRTLVLLSISALILTCVSFYSCFTPNKVSVQNIADIYHSDYHYLHPQFTIYQVNDSNALLYYKLNEEELLYIRRNQEDSFYSSAKIICRVTAAYESNQMMDSSSVVLKFSSITNNKKAFAIGSILLKLKSNHNYLVTAYTTDLVSKKEEVSFINLPASDDLGSRNFLVTNNTDGQPLFPNYIDSDANLTITGNKPIQKLTVNYFRRDFPMAAPPFGTSDATLSYKPDSTFIINADANGKFSLSVHSSGIYHVQVDTSSRNGVTIYRFQKYYPVVGLPAQLIPPLRYITSNEEYSRLTSANDVKKAVDEFWINLAGSQERAKSLIRIFYSRVQDANKYFTSYVEGWKSDRGMIYIIYGPPNVVYKNSYSESWIYGEDRNFMSLTFVFRKTDNPLTGNDYGLERSAQFRNVWYNAVDIWREGRVY
jgi:GWxTD domain-containing protein